jgi:hypothetical protein
MGVYSGPKFSNENFTVRLFTSSGTFTPSFTGVVEVLVVAGGGGAGSDMGGGGGGGGVISTTSYSVTAGSPITVTVGAGGTGAPAGAGGHATTKGTNGVNSVFGTLTAIGGGAGGTSYYTFGNSFGNSGGSGGGGSGYNNSQTPALRIGTGYGAAGAGTMGQGFRGGWGNSSYYSGGGGGAGGPGVDANAIPHGGPGILNRILDQDLYWGGGGGGAAYSVSPGGNGGIGGGGGGAIGTTTGGAGYNNGSPGGGGSPGSWANTPGGNGGQNTGGGGGGGAHYNATNQGGDGGSGIVIVRYVSSLGAATGGSELPFGIQFSFDIKNTNKSWRGIPTTNLIDETMSIYNNVPGNVTVTLEATQEKYLGATVYKQTITPINATGVAQLTGGNNPGIGVVIPGAGGGLANRSTGHAIFYKTECAMHTTPLFTNYSNISGWGAGPLGSDRSVAQGDGWFRGEVIWFDTTTRSDGKYWAINPASAVLNSSIVVYWAAPFKEDRNDNTFVAPYVKSSRSQTQSLLDLTGRSTITINNLTYATDNTFSFNGSTDGLTIPGNIDFSNAQTIEIWLMPTENDGNRRNPYNQAYGGYGTWTHEPSGQFNYYYGDGGGNNEPYVGHTSAFTVAQNELACICSTRDVNSSKWYKNGVFDSEYTHSFGRLATTTADILIGNGYAGRYLGNIYSVSIYNKALTAEEVQQRFNSVKNRYGL